MKIIYQVLVYSHMRGEWVCLAGYDTKEEAIAKIQSSGPDNYKIEEVYCIRKSNELTQ